MYTMETTREPDPLRRADESEADDLACLVDGLAEGTSLARNLEALLATGADGRAALVRGLGDGRWQVRRACLYGLHTDATPEARHAAVPLLRDPRASVRAAAVGVVGYVDPETPPEAAAGHPEAVPLLMERVYQDESIRVRRQAVLHLAWFHAHPHLESLFQALLDGEIDAKLHQWAGIGLLRSRSASDGATS